MGGEAKGKGKAPAKASTHDLKTEEVLQALILADSFDQRFTPITLEKPRSLLPIVNIPLLNYTIEFLAASGVQEIFVFCCAHAQQIKEYLGGLKGHEWSGVRVRAVVSLNCKSAGDALREVYAQSVIDSDFILVTGDVISNMNLQKPLQLHKLRREKDKSSIMTMIFKQAGPTHQTRSLEDDTIVAIDGATQQLVQYENSRTSTSVVIDPEVFSEHAEVDLRYDLIDCHIDICAPEVLFIFTDNFDYQDIRRDFIKGLMSSEILGYKINSYVIQGEYAARVKDLRTYNSVSKDIIHRWAYPMVPDSNFLAPTSFSRSRLMVYKEKKVLLSRSCTIGSSTALGEGTEVGDNSTISNSVIGRNCKIGSHVMIKGSFLWDNVIVKDGATIIDSILCNGVVVHNKAIIQKGSILSFNVVVGKDFITAPFTKITAYTPESEEDEEEEEEIVIEDINLGEGGKGKLWIAKTEATNTIVPIDEESEKIVEVEDDEDLHTGSKKKKEVEQQEEWVSDDKKFATEVADTVRRAVTEGHSIDNTALEVNALKFAYDQTFLDCANAIISTLMNIIAESKQNPLVSAFNPMFSKWGPLLSRFITSDEDQVELIYTLEEFCGKEGEGYKTFFSLFQHILHSMYESDVVGEDAIMEWADSLENESAEDKVFLKQCEKFLTWLREAEEDEDDEDEDDSEDEE